MNGDLQCWSFGRVKLLTAPADRRLKRSRPRLLSPRSRRDHTQDNRTASLPTRSGNWAGAAAPL